MSTELTLIQTKILKFIEKSIKTTGIPPSIKEISEHSGLSSSSSVHHQLLALEKKGYILRDKTKSRSIKISHKKKEDKDLSGKNYDFPLVVFDENLNPICSDIWSLPISFTGAKDVFLFRIENYELENLGIFANDIAVIEYNDSPASGEIVMAIVQNKIVIRTLLRREDKFILSPHSLRAVESEHQELVFVGILKGLLRTIQVK